MKKNTIIKACMVLAFLCNGLLYAQSIRKPVGRSIHIATNDLDAQHYCHTPSLYLPFPEKLAKQMCGLADRLGYKSKLLLGEHATTKNVLAEMDDAAATLKDGDMFLITFCGHGGQLNDMNGDDKDRKDETWCLYDNMLVDDVLQAKWIKFKKGVRILVIADCCHSGTNLGMLPGDKVQALPADEDNCTYEKNKPYYDAILTDSSLLVAEDSIMASIKSFAACRDDQTTKNGFFSQKILETMTCDFLGNYDFYDRYLNHLLNPRGMNPQYCLYGKHHQLYNNSRPFQITY